MGKKVVVLGSTGMAGHMIAHYMEEQGFAVYRVSRSEKKSNTSRKIDVANIEQVIQFIDEVGADVVINCVGLLQKRCEERVDLAVLINSYMPHCLEYHYKESMVKIIHLSTDCVFSGERGNYRESDIPDGKTFYDRTKSLGEINNNKDLTFRMSIIGPDIDENGTGLLSWFMKQSGTINGYTNAIWNGVTTLELAEAIVKAIEFNLVGLYHLVPDGNINKYDLLLLVQKIFKKTNIKIVEDGSLSVDKSLINSRCDFSYQIKDYPTQLLNMKLWIDKNRDLYPGFYF